jgi:hypothetical protein
MSHVDYSEEIFNGTITAGDPATNSSTYELPEGLFMEKVGLWTEYDPDTGGNILELVAEWAGSDGIFLPTAVSPSGTTTTSCVFTVCNPGGARKLRLLISSTGTGDDTVSVTAKTITEE